MIVVKLEDCSMPEDVVAINAEFETQKRCNDVSRLFQNLRMETLRTTVMGTILPLASIY